MIRKIAKLLLGRKITERLALKFPCWNTFNINLSRLYPFMVVGGSAAYSTFLRKPLDKEKVVDITLPQQNVYACNECIRSFFSILKEGAGTVCLAMTEQELSDNSQTLLPLHYEVLREYLYPDTNHNRRKSKYPLLFQPLWTLECLGIRMSVHKRNETLVEGEKLTTINNFCKERDLSFLLVTLGDWTAANISEIDKRDIAHCYEQEFRDMVSHSGLRCLSF